MNEAHKECLVCKRLYHVYLGIELTPVEKRAVYNSLVKVLWASISQLHMNMDHLQDLDFIDKEKATELYTKVNKSLLDLTMYVENAPFI